MRRNLMGLSALIDYDTMSNHGLWQYTKLHNTCEVTSNLPECKKMLSYAAIFFALQRQAIC